MDIKNIACGTKSEILEYLNKTYDFKDSTKYNNKKPGDLFLLYDKPSLEEQIDCIYNEPQSAGVIPYLEVTSGEADESLGLCMEIKTQWVFIRNSER